MTSALPLRVLAWEVTRRCPMACQHCRGNAQNQVYAEELSTREAEQVVEHLAEEPTRPLLIFTGGEPLERSDLEHLVAYANAKGFSCVLAPCGIGLTKERLQALKAAGIRMLSLSVDGPTAELHDAFRGVPGAFERILRVMALAQEVGMPFQVNATLTKTSAPHLRALRDFALAQGAKRLDCFFLVPVGRGAALRAQCLDDTETEQALREILALDAEGVLPLHVTCEPRILQAIATSPTPPKSTFNGCLAGRAFCFLSHIGEVQPCGFFARSGGNIRDFALSLPAAWRASTLFATLHGGATCLAR